MKSLNQKEYILTDEIYKKIENELVSRLKIYNFKLKSINFESSNKNLVNIKLIKK